MKRIYTCLLAFLSIGLLLSIKAQDNRKTYTPTDSILAYMRNAMLFNMTTPQEKVYMHFDNTGYFKGERMWYKAYVTRTDKSSLSDISKVLYVELVNPSGEAVVTQKHPIVNGEAHGDMKLDSIMGSGFYEVRAYTRYMTNWGNGGIFSRVFPIFKQPKVEGDYSDMVIDQISYKKRLPSSREEISDNLVESGSVASATNKNMKVKFYPEGGNLVNGLKSRVAFTIHSEDGSRLDAKGQIIDKNGTFICDVKTLGEDNSECRGQGIFEITPSKDTPMYLVIKDKNGKDRKFMLPEALDEGVTMSFNALGDDELTATFHSSMGMQGKMLGYTIIHNGNVINCDTLIAETEMVRSFSRYSLPAGVSQLTLYDSSGRIHADRLFFICPFQSDNDSIRVKPSKDSNETLDPCCKVELDIEASPNSSLSFSAMDAATLTGGKVGNARTYMLLASEVKGYIDNPDYYFEADDKDHRFASDMLMMIQGWRRYDWRLMTGIQGFEKSIQPIEDKLYIFGKLLPKRQKNTVDNVALTAFLFNKKGYSLRGEAITDSTGNYAFALPDMEGDWNLQILTQKEGEKTNYRVTINRQFSPERRTLSKEELTRLQPNAPNMFLPKKIVEEEFEEGLNGDDYVSITKRIHVLPTIRVKGRYFTNDANVKWYDEKDALHHSSIYYNCDQASDAYADKGEDIPVIYEWLEQKNEFFHYDKTMEPFMQTDTDTNQNLFEDGHFYKGRPIIWIIDNCYAATTNTKSLKIDSSEWRVLKSTVAPIPTFLNEIKSIYISEDPRASASFLYAPQLQNGDPVTFFVYTHPTVTTESQKGLRRTHFQGYNTPSTFEMEDYSVLPPMEDFRRTIYWKHDVRTDNEGKAKVEFFNNSSCKQMYISVEGFSPNGRFIVNE